MAKAQQPPPTEKPIEAKEIPPAQFKSAGLRVGRLINQKCVIGRLMAEKVDLSKPMDPEDFEKVLKDAQDYCTEQRMIEKCTIAKAGGGSELDQACLDKLKEAKRKSLQKALKRKECLAKPTDEMIVLKAEIKSKKRALSDLIKSRCFTEGQTTPSK